MRDKYTRERVKELDPLISDEVAVTIAQTEKNWPANVSVRITEAFRPDAKQDAYYAIGRTRPGKIITNATAGKSAHQYRRAFDVCIMIDGQPSWKLDKYFKELVAALKAKGYEWAGDWVSFKEYPHFQKLLGKTIAQLYSLKKAGKVIDGYVRG